MPGACCTRGAGQALGDLPVRLICRRLPPEIGLAQEANQFAEREKSCPPERSDVRSSLDKVPGCRGACHRCVSAIALVVGRAFARPVGSPGLRLLPNRRPKEAGLDLIHRNF
jgi:hypothetical protein